MNFAIGSSFPGMQASTSAPLATTPVTSRHRELGAKLAPFAGFEMPIQYSGIRAEHQAVRERVGLFDVSHMGNLDVSGPGAAAFLDKLTLNHVAALEPGAVHYTAALNPQGGILDDLLINALPGGGYRVVINASNVGKIVSWMGQHAGSDVSLNNRSGETAILSLQGPAAARVADSVTGTDLSSLASFRGREVTWQGETFYASRTGYTGEDGFEFYPPAKATGALWDALLAAGKAEGILPVGLGARDTLRLEAGLSLYGHELSENTNPLEAGIGWVIAWDKGDFMGRAALEAVKQAGLPRKMVGLMLEETGIPREGCAVFEGDREVGRVTSGTLSPTLGKGIALAYVQSECAERERRLAVDIRGSRKACTVVNRRFYQRKKQ